MSIQVAFTWRGVRFRETLKLEPTKQNMRYAENLRGEILRKIELNTFNPVEYFPNSKKLRKLGYVKPSTLFKDQAEQWYKTRTDLAKSTLTSYRKNLDHHILPQFGDMNIGEIKHGMIMAWLGETPWQSMKTRNNVLIPLRGIFEVAFLDRVINENPMARILNAKTQKAEPDPLTLQEVSNVLGYMRRYDEQVVNYFQFAFFAGLRPSELVELKWGDIDFTRELAVISRAKVEGKVKTTKTDRIRYIELGSMAMFALKRQKLHTFMKDEGYVFNNPNTRKPWADEQSQRKYWTATLKALGMRHRDAYQTRHTFATMHLMVQANPAWIAKQMGHTTPKMIFEVYARWLILSDAGREKSKLENVLNDTTMAQEKTGTD